MIKIKLHNTLTRKKQTFVPLDENDVRLYLCGPTVYDRAHLGNARNVIMFDVLYRLLIETYGIDNINYVRNFTDIDDKINNKSLESGRPINDITSETIKWYLEDMAALGNLEPNLMPRATDFIPQMISYIELLIKRGFAYTDEGHVLFSVSNYKNYGRLSGRSIEDMIAGARVEVASYKRNPMDFVLWKPSEQDLPGWESPWGRGRPGWHIECSAMAHELLGPNFDIHGGGNDLQFPHHENEIAQSCCAYPESEFARYWLHNEMLQVDGKKMSKSLGNYFSPKELMDDGIPGGAIRLMYLNTHYRKPLDWTENKLSENLRLYRKWVGLIEKSDIGEVSSDVVNAVADDLNTPLALTEMHKLAKTGNLSCLKASGLFLGLFCSDSNINLREKLPQEITLLIDNLLKERDKARLRKDYARADELRDGFVSSGLKINDTEEGINWELTDKFDYKKLEALK